MLKPNSTLYTSEQKKYSFQCIKCKELLTYSNSKFQNNKTRKFPCPHCSTINVVTLSVRYLISSNPDV